MTTLKTETRELGLSSGELNRFRKQGRIPAVVYGKGLSESKSVWVNQVDFMKVYHETGKIMEMSVDGKTEMVNAKVLDRGPMGSLMHVNFHQLKRGQKTMVRVPLHSEGEAKGVKDGGILSWSHETIQLEGVPKDIPESITIDISALEIGGVIHASDIKLAKGLTLMDEGEMTILSIQAPSKAAEAETAGAEEASEGTEAAAAAAPAGDEEA